MTNEIIYQTSIALLLGVSTALIYLYLLQITVAGFLRQGVRDFSAWGLTLLRWGLLVGVFLLSIHWGTAPFLACGAGFFLSRSLALARFAKDIS